MKSLLIVLFEEQYQTHNKSHQNIHGTFERTSSLGVWSRLPKGWGGVGWRLEKSEQPVSAHFALTQ